MMNARSFVSAGLLLVGLPAYADTGPGGQARGVPTILITPEWRPTGPPGSPPASHSLSAPELDAAGVWNTQDLQYDIPGLVFKSSAGIGDPYLRGVGGTVSASGDSGVATFVDSVPMTRAGQSLQELYDIARIDVLKGPQNVALGRNVTGGAISVVTRDPVPYREARADLSFGTRNRRQVRGAVNLPWSGSGLSFRLAGTLIGRDGYSRNVYRNEDLDDRDYYALRGKVRFQPSDDLDVLFSAERARQDDTRDLAKQPNSLLGVNGGILWGGVVPDDPRRVTANVDQNQDVTNSIYRARVYWHGDGASLQSITAYQKMVQHLVLDLDSTDIDYSANFPATSSTAISQEFRIQSRDEGSLGWVGGVYLQRKEAWQKQDVRLPLAGFVSRPISDTTSDSYAVFGSTSYRFRPQWQARLGLRYSRDEANLDLVQSIEDPFGLMGVPDSFSLESRQRDQWEAVTPEFGLTYWPDAATQLHATVSRGYKPGGYNAHDAQSAYAPEFLWAYEAGIRTAFPGGKLRVNAALFRYDYRDIQLLTLPPGAPAGTWPIIDNAARAGVQGLDLQAWYRPAWNFDLSLGVTFLHARYEDFLSVDPNNPDADPDRSGDPLQQAPDLSLLLGGAYRWRLPESGDVKLSVDYRYQSAVYFNPYKDHAVRQGGYGLLNAHLGFESGKGEWYLELYAHNLADKLYAQNIVRLDPVAGTARYWAAPRTYGIRVGRRL